MEVYLEIGHELEGRDIGGWYWQQDDAYDEGVQQTSFAGWGKAHDSALC
jgi:hypothetical protein